MSPRDQILAKGAWAQTLFCQFPVHKNFPWAVLCALSPSDDRLAAAALPLVNRVLETAVLQPGHVAEWTDPLSCLSLSSPELLRTVIGEQEEVSVTFQICMFRSVTFPAPQAWIP